MKLLVVIVCLVTVSTLNIPNDYVFDVQPSCAKTKDGVTAVHVLTDLDVHVEGECKDNYIAQFDTTNYVDWHLNASYHGNSLYECLFTKKKGSSTYNLYLSVSWAEPGEVMLNHDIYMITCILDDHGKTKSNVKTIKQGLIGPQEIQSHMGGDATSKFSLKLTDVRGNPLNTTVPLGRKVQLTAKILVSSEPGAKDEVGIRAINCAAMGGASSYKILRGGCGDGIVLPRDMGFMTTGVISKSPIFNAFRLAKSGSLSFHCNFTTCKKECDGDSCVTETRRKRSLGHHYTEPETSITIPLTFDINVRSLSRRELSSADIKTQEVQVRSASGVQQDIIQVDPCTIPGMDLEGCTGDQPPKEKDISIGVAALMMVVMVVFPVLLIFGIFAFLCCSKTESYGLNDETKDVSAT